MLCQSDLILLHKWGLDDSQSHTTVSTYSSLDISDEPILEFWHLKQKCGFEANWPSIQNINQST